jgi:SAM-dependent MidA family methyltransferase
MIQSLSQFMLQRLFDPVEGFYETQPIDEHFATPSTLSSSYHIYLKNWLLKRGVRSVIELGAGTGAMAATLAPFFKTYGVLEKSAKQRAYQKEFFEQEAIFEHVQFLEDLPDRFQGLVIAQEVFDCLPVNMYHFHSITEITEWMIQGGSLVERPCAFEGLSPCLKSYIQSLRDFHQPLVSVMDCEPSQTLLKALFEKMAAGAELLIIDYGSLWPLRQGPSCPLRGFYKHQLIESPWALREPCDLTYSIDFSLLAQTWEDLGGIAQWSLPFAEFLGQELEWREIDPTSNDRILFDPRLMGGSFMALILKKGST